MRSRQEGGNLMEMLERREGGNRGRVKEMIQSAGRLRGSE